ncbi:MAG: hypothetical protein AB8C46_05520 [Burkholderiaceae bacterium]
MSVDIETGGPMGNVSEPAAPGQDEVNLTLLPSQETNPSPVAPDTASSERLSIHFITPDMIGAWINNPDSPGNRIINDEFAKHGIANRDDQRMVAGLLFFTRSGHVQVQPSLGFEASLLLADFLQSQAVQRNSYGTAEKATADANLQEARHAAWEFLNAEVGGSGTLPPARMNGPVIHHF